VTVPLGFNTVPAGTPVVVGPGFGWSHAFVDVDEPSVLVDPSAPLDPPDDDEDDEEDAPPSGDEPLPGDVADVSSPHATKRSKKTSRFIRRPSGF
jgi:hypothetical protein